MPASADSVHTATPIAHTGPPRRRRWVRVCRVVAIFLAALALMAGGILAVRYYDSHVRLQTALTLAEEARALMDQGDDENASRKIDRAYRIMPREPAVMRTMAQLMMRHGRASEALWLWRQLDFVTTPSMEDQAGMAETCLSQNQAEEARTILQEMPESAQNLPVVMEVRASLLRVDGRTAEADALLRQALALQPERPISVLRLASMDLAAPFPETQATALNKLWELSRTREAIALRAWELLARHPQLTAPQSQELLDLVNAHPAATDRARYAVLHALVRLQPSLKQATVEAESQRQQGRPLDQSLDYLGWLSALGEHERILSLVPEDRVIDVPSLAPVYLEALAGLERWQDIRRVLKRATHPMLPPSETALLQARCARGLKEGDSQVRAHLEDACRRALGERQYSTLERVATALERFGHADLAHCLYEDASTVPAFRVPALEKLYEIHSQRRESGRMLALLREMDQAGSRTREHAATEVYLMCLMGLELEGMPERITLLEQDGSLTPHRAALLRALVTFRAGDLAALRATVTDIDPAKLTSGQCAVLAGMLQACGEIARAFAVGEPIVRSALLPEEERLLGRAL